MDNQEAQTSRLQERSGNSTFYVNHALERKKCQEGSNGVQVCRATARGKESRGINTTNILLTATLGEVDAEAAPPESTCMEMIRLLLFESS